MAAPISLLHGVIIVSDKDGVGAKLTLDLEDGDLSYTLPKPHLHAMDRGAPGVIIENEFEPITFSMTVKVQKFTGSPELPDIIMRTASGGDFDKVDIVSGDYSALTASDLQDVDSNVGVFQMKVSYTNPNTAATENLYFIDCTGTIDFSEGVPNKFTVNGMSYQTVDTFMTNID